MQWVHLRCSGDGNGPARALVGSFDSLQTVRLTMREQKPTSETVVWSDEHEIFQFVTKCFDVRAAKRIIREKPRKIETAVISGLRDLVNRPKKGSITMGIAIDWERIDRDPEGEIRCTVPIILITEKDGGTMPIDGWHRIAKALDSGLTSLPAVCLNKTESKKCML